MTHDACIMATAKHLAVGFGTWGPSFSNLNMDLRDLYVPWAEDAISTDKAYGGQLAGISDHWFHEAIHEARLSYNQHMYSFHGFSASDANFANVEMTTFPAERVFERVIPSEIENA